MKLETKIKHQLILAVKQLLREDKLKKKSSNKKKGRKNNG